MQQYFALDMPAGRFARNTLVASLLGLLPLIVLYVALTPGFAAQPLSGGPALGRFLRQVLTNGLPVAFVVNYIGFFLFAWTVDRHPGGRGWALVLLVDLPMRVVLFVALRAVIYTVSADWFGSFGGSRLTALKVVAPTLSLRNFGERAAALRGGHREIELVRKAAAPFPGAGGTAPRRVGAVRSLSGASVYCRGAHCAAAIQLSHARLP
jgi:hypothetical protein